MAKTSYGSIFSMEHSFTALGLHPNWNSSLNITTFRNLSSQSVPYWNLRTVYSAVSKLIILFLNALIVFLFFRHRSVRTSFNVYVVNLAIVYIDLWIYYPVSLINDWTVWIPKPKFICAFLRYNTYTFGGLVMNSHFLIALNRLWAVTSPISYKNFHHGNSLKRPAITCFVMWVIIHLLNLPTVIIDLLEPQAPAEYIHCAQAVRGPRWWVVTVTCLAYNIPLLSSVMIYPFILHKTLFGPRVRRVNVSSHPRSDNTNSTTVASSQGHSASGHAVAHTGDEPVENSDSCWGRLQGRGGGQFLTMSLLSVNVAVSMLPMQLFFMLQFFGADPPGMFSIVAIPFTLSYIIDPVIFLLTLKTMRDAMKRSFKTR